MKLIHIVAMDRNGAIGKEGSLPWYLPDDLKWFKEATLGKICIVGRKTYQSLPTSVKEDPDRTFIVLSRTGLTLENALNIFSNHQDDIMIIGGSEVYLQTSALVEELWITHVDTEVQDADAYYPKDTLSNFAPAERILLNNHQGINAEVIRYLRKYKPQPLGM